MKHKVFITNNKQEYQVEENTSFLSLIKKNSSLKPFKNAFLVKDEQKGCYFSLSTPINSDVTISLVTQGDNKIINEILNRSCGHVLINTIKQIYPEALATPVEIHDDKFFIDLELNKPLTQKDLNLITNKLKKNISQNLAINHLGSLLDCESELKKVNSYFQFFTQLFAQDSKKQNYQVFSCNQQLNISCLPEIHASRFLSNFKLLSSSSAYWQNNKNNKNLQRIYGVCFDSDASLQKYLTDQEKKLASDHRHLNKQLSFYFTDDLVGQGLPVWMPNGQTVRHQIMQYLYDLEEQENFLHVSSPILGSLQLYQASGHYQLYHQSMFPVIKVDQNEKFCLRPMTCPHHCIAFKHIVSSYLDLPCRIAENSTLFRYESSGSLSGIERARVMCLNDAHIFISLEQLKDEFIKMLSLIEKVLTTFNIKLDYYRLSLRGEDNEDSKYYDDDEMWNYAENTMRKILKSADVKYQEALGEAAFYGPKLDLQIKNNNGHDVTLATIQLDFLLAKNLNVTYLDKDQKPQYPIIIHRSLIGTYERFIATLLEQNNGFLQFFISPLQVVILPVDYKKHAGYAKQVYQMLKVNKFRVKLDLHNDRLAHKIRKYQLQKTNFQIVIGDKECADNTISIRAYGSNETMAPKNWDETLEFFNEQNKTP